MNVVSADQTLDKVANGCRINIFIYVVLAGITVYRIGPWVGRLLVIG